MTTRDTEDSDVVLVEETVETERISYEDFGVAFIQHAVSPARIEATAAGLEGRQINIGPMRTGPAGLATVTVKGHVGSPEVVREEGELVSYLMTIPVSLDLVIELAGQNNKFKADVQVPVQLTACAAPPLRIVIDIRELTYKDVTVRVRAEGVGATVLQIVGGIDREIRKQVASYVSEQINSPEMRASRDIDVAARLAGK